MTNLKNLSLADLVALHTNWWLSEGHGARFDLLTTEQFENVERELQDRMADINFKEGTSFSTENQQK